MNVYLIRDTKTWDYGTSTGFTKDPGQARVWTRISDARRWCTRYSNYGTWVDPWGKPIPKVSLSIETYFLEKEIEYEIPYPEED